MKKFIKGIGQSVQGYWRHMMNNSTNVKMSCGAQYITRLMTCAHRDQWRRSPKK